jgi:Ni2+-binding GTPase involved in maturation of urease and hydrogenase
VRASAGRRVLLEHTIRRLDAQRQVSVIEGDHETLLDAEMIECARSAPSSLTTTLC